MGFRLKATSDMKSSLHASASGRNYFKCLNRHCLSTSAPRAWTSKALKANES